MKNARYNDQDNTVVFTYSAVKPSDHNKPHTFLYFIIENEGPQYSVTLGLIS
jgi:hypothetical protein